MSNLRNQLNKVADVNENEEFGHQAVTEVQKLVYTSSCQIHDAWEKADKNQYFKEFLNSKGANGESIVQSMFELATKINDLEKELERVAKQANY